MKNIKTTKSIVALLLAASATSLSAIERPVPADQPKEKKAQEVKPQLKEKALPMPKAALRPYLGVMGDCVSEAMSAQLNLEPRIGITLLFVQDGSPADKAGLKKHDIITKIGEVEVGNQNQLRDAILKLKPNEKVELNYISGGQAITKQVELGSAPMVDLPDLRNNQGEIMPKLNGQIPHGAIPLDMLQNLPPEQRLQLQQLLEGNLNQLNQGNLRHPNLDQLQQQFDGFDQMPKLDLKMGDLMKQGFQQKGRMKMVDPDGSVTLETDGDQKSIELHDADGKLQYKGPFNTDADKLKIPENLRERTSRLQFHDKPRVRILPNLKQPEAPQNDEQIGEAEIPQELKDLLKKLEAQEDKFGNKPQIQKFEFKLNGKELTQQSSRSLVGPDGNRYTKNESKEGKEIEIKDPEGNLLFSGPYNSSVDKEMVPEEYRPSLEKLEAMGGFMKGDLKKGFKIEMGPNGPKP